MISADIITTQKAMAVAGANSSTTLTTTLLQRHRIDILLSLEQTSHSTYQFMRITFTFFPGLALVIGLLFVSCSKDDQSTPPANPSFKGDFVSAAHQTKGVASIDQEKAALTLTNFKTDSGPDLNIYLTKSLSAITSDFIDLGDIKGVKGNYTYALPDPVDYTLYKYVIVWCVDFDVNFGYAELVQQ